MKANRTFYKMSGSGNDFVFFDLRDGTVDWLEKAAAIRALCARGTGVGADGVVFLESRTDASFSMKYYNSDGSLGELCGNAALCAVRLAHETRLANAEQVSIETDAGVLHARMADGLPEIDLAPVTEVVPELLQIKRIDREERLGFARAGVPHVTILDADAAAADVMGRGSSIRRDRSLEDGANVNFVSPKGNEWLIRTYERGVEGETLACGTGAVASAILLIEWGKAQSPVSLRTKSGRVLQVRVSHDAKGWHASLRGSAEIVFEGQLRGLDA
ncbi:MAG: diaminopimelate epimerase [Gemmatimonadales bacterium]